MIWWEPETNEHGPWRTYLTRILMHQLILLKAAIPRRNSALGDKLALGFWEQAGVGRSLM
jgi:hypothetical protein